MTQHPHSPRPRLLTLLTRPVATGDWRHLMKWGWERWSGVPWEGHRALALNTLHGLRRIGQRAVLNPLRLPRKTDAVLVVWAPRTIEWLVQHPRRSRFTLALAPTAVTTVTSQFPHLAAMADGIDLVLPASPWQQKRFEDTDATAAFADKYRIWPAGVDTSWWSPGETPTGDRKHRLLIYHKRCPEGILDMVRSTAGSLGWKVQEIHYGQYTLEDFRHELRCCELAVFLSDWESQGIALAEAWSCDVPTLAWTSDKHYQFQHTAPYLSSSTGHLFVSKDDLHTLLAGGWKTDSLSPRSWVLENMSLERSAEILVEHLCREVSESVNQ